VRQRPLQVIALLAAAGCLTLSQARPAHAQTSRLEPNSVKRYMFDCATPKEAAAELKKREITPLETIPGPKPGGSSIFKARFANGLEIPYVIENTDGRFYIYAELRRPQYPIPPIPYVEQEVVFDNPEAKLSFVGTLTVPHGSGPFPGVVLVAGTGAHTRDEVVSLHKIFLVLADGLTRHGMAVLRFDKRGVGLSGGKPFPESTTDDNASDARAAVRFLRIQPGIDPARVGLVGHSEGGIIAPLVAAGNPEVAFIVLLAGTGLPGLEVQVLQDAAGAKAAGADEKTLRATEKLDRAIFPIVVATKDKTEAMKKMHAAERAILTADERKLLGIPEAGLPDEAYEGLLTPWFRRFLELDPRPVLEKVTCPVLAINGGKDLQVLADENLAGIERALAKGGNNRVTIKKLPGINHMFQTAPIGSGNEYRNIEETFASAALELISHWILETMRLAPGTF